MSGKANFLVTFCLVTTSYLLSISLSSIGDALTIVGSTITPTVGYIVPAVFYLRVHPSKPLLSREKALPLLVIVMTVVVSAINLTNFFINKKD